ncbi:unnamed protein product [Anisakis simplex]|uniref:Suppressor of cytokine signaling at 16d n=1 Tax=Anisakis simplex TaxID=6269 RepID=A0A0M3K0V5_ANISI|nr:unnamed protein product [Anisakis simplex]
MMHKSSAPTSPPLMNCLADGPVGVSNDDGSHYLLISNGSIDSVETAYPFNHASYTLRTLSDAQDRPYEPCNNSVENGNHSPMDTLSPLPETCLVASSSMSEVSPSTGLICLPHTAAGGYVLYEEETMGEDLAVVESGEGVMLASHCHSSTAAEHQQSVQSQKHHFFAQQQHQSHNHQKRFHMASANAHCRPQKLLELDSQFSYTQQQQQQMDGEDDDMMLTDLNTTSHFYDVVESSLTVSQYDIDDDDTHSSTLNRSHELNQGLSDDRAALALFDEDNVALLTEEDSVSVDPRYSSFTTTSATNGQSTGQTDFEIEFESAIQDSPQAQYSQHQLQYHHLQQQQTQDHHLQQQITYVCTSDNVSATHQAYVCAQQTSPDAIQSQSQPLTMVNNNNNCKNVATRNRANSMTTKKKVVDVSQTKNLVKKRSLASCAIMSYQSEEMAKHRAKDDSNADDGKSTGSSAAATVRIGTTSNISNRASFNGVKEQQSVVNPRRIEDMSVDDDDDEEKLAIPSPAMLNDMMSRVQIFALPFDHLFAIVTLV